jgi:hypothetical protein
MPDCNIIAPFILKIRRERMKEFTLKPDEIANRLESNKADLERAGSAKTEL